MFLGKYLDKFVLVFLDGILIYSYNEDVEHFRLTLKLLRKHKLYAGLSKCDFYKDRIHHLGQIISDRGISIDSEEIQAMMIWPAPRKLIDVRYLVGLARYCRNFTKEYSTGKVEYMYRLRKSGCELEVP